MSRNMLHISKLEEFKQWLDSEGIQHRPGKGAYQVLQVCKDGTHWNGIYVRIETPEHFTVDRYLEPLVAKFIRLRKQEDNGK